MINAPRLLADLTRQLKRLEDDLRQRIGEQPDIDASLRAEWQTARDAKRCAETFESWADQVITQAGVHWLLSCVFLRFIEDNQLVDRPWLSGTPESGRLALARDRHEAYFRAHPLESDREYLLAAFREAGKLPGLHTFFDEAHNPVFRIGISGDAAMAMRQFWQQVNTDTGALVHDFTDPDWNTRFLGDLYEHLSISAQERYALRQTPEFVEEFILDRTLTPAVRTFGFRELRMIDPTCGSGHFLLGGFHRLVSEWQRQEPGRHPGDIAQKALDAVAGVDLNPFAVAISRFRLLVAALHVAGVRRLANAPAFTIHVAIGDSLLHGTRFGMTGTQSLLGDDQFAGTGLAHAYASEDLTEVQRILSRQYHAVVGNPPYIVVKDAALNAAYRSKYASCHRQYSLGCPFTERFFDLAVTGNNSLAEPAGYVGLITTDTFKRREFGIKLVQEVLPRLDLTHVIDTSGAFIPGHGTPTVILLGRHQPPVGDEVRNVMGIRGEPSKPIDPAHGQVWSAILDQIDRPGSEGQFVSVTDTRRETLSRHPWSFGGGGAVEVTARLTGRGTQPLARIAEVYGGTGRTSADDVLSAPMAAFRRKGASEFALPLIEGEQVRDWLLSTADAILTPYTSDGLMALADLGLAERWLWPARTVLGNRIHFGSTTYFEQGRPWWSWHQMSILRLTYTHAIAYAEIATHNHFVLDRGGKVFKQTAPVIKLPTDSSEDDQFGLLGLLNSSAVCFWLKQVCQKKGAHLAGKRTREERYAFNATNAAEIPICAERPQEIARRIDALSSTLANQHPAALLSECGAITRAKLDVARTASAALRGQMIAAQEELDWQCYRLYGLLPEDAGSKDFEYTTPPELQLGERAFEIVLARRMAAGEESTTWFERHGSTPLTEVPTHWPADYRTTVERRIALIERDRNIGLIERPEFKRRWNGPTWREQEQVALRNWLVDRLEQSTFWPDGADTPPQLSTTNRLADAARADAEFTQVAALYAGHADFDPARLMADLVAAEAVPLLPVQRYTDDGLRKRSQWEDTWAMQRAEDTIDAEVNIRAAERRQELMKFVSDKASSASPDADALKWVDETLDKEVAPIRRDRKARELGAIPVPPKYTSSDFLNADFWRHRGGLDVPKERFVTFPGAERGADGSLVIAWAGWNHLQLATALAGYYVEMKDTEGWEPARLQPLLAGLLELVPWLEQWHNELDPVFGERMGSYYKGFVTEEARALGFTLDDLRAWKPAVAAAKRGRKKATAASEG